MTDKPSTPPPPAPWMEDAAHAIRDAAALELPGSCYWAGIGESDEEVIAALIQKHAPPLQASSAREERLAALVERMIPRLRADAIEAHAHAYGTQERDRLGLIAEARKALEER